jgi:hypothetical protein
MAITETRTLPAQFIEDIGKEYAKQLTAGTAVPVDTSKFAPQVAAQDPLQQEAARLAGTGIGAFQPYLQAAQAATGPQAYQAYMSPYQQQVIDTTLSEFDRQRAIQEKSLADQAIAAGAFGGGREGVQRAEFASQSARDRAAIQAQLLQQGFGQAQQAAAQQYQQQVGLASLLPQLQRADISTLGQVGAAQQSQQQAILDAQRQAAQTAAYEPLQRLGFFGSGVTGLLGGYPAQYQFGQTPSASPLQTAIGVGTGLAGIFGALK